MYRYAGYQAVHYTSGWSAAYLQARFRRAVGWSCNVVVIVIVQKVRHVGFHKGSMVVSLTALLSLVFIVQIEAVVLWASPTRIL